MAVGLQNPGNLLAHLVAGVVVGHLQALHHALVQVLLAITVSRCFGLGELDLNEKKGGVLLHEEAPLLLLESLAQAGDLVGIVGHV